MQELFIKLANRKVIIPVVIVVVTLEAVWAVSVLKQPAGSLAPSSPSANSLAGKKASVSMQTAKKTYRVGEEVIVDISIYAPKLTDGTDLIMSYDPTTLAIKRNQTGSVVKTSGSYSDYPVNEVDEKAGRITVSGITSTPGGVIPTGSFGRVSFTAQKQGKTIVSFVFTPGSSVDSNIVETKTAKDFLGEVNNLEVTIVP